MLYSLRKTVAIYESILEDLPFVMKQGGHVVLKLVINKEIS